MTMPARTVLTDDAAYRGFRLALERQEATLVVRLGGDFDLASIDRIEAALLARGPATRHMVIDLRAVTFIDMAGMLTLIRTNECSHAESFDLRIVPPAGLARRVFTLTRAREQLPLVEDAGAAASGSPTRS